MPEESYSFTQARLRLEEIVTQVRKKDVSLESSLDLLEEGVRLANQCTELIDSADWEAAGLVGETSAQTGAGELDSDMGAGPATSNEAAANSEFAPTDGPAVDDEFAADDGAVAGLEPAADAQPESADFDEV